MLNRIIILFAGIILFVGCNKKFVLRKNKLDTDYKDLVEYIRQNDSVFNTYSIKYTGKFSSTQRNLRFRGLLRIIKDERIWVSISPMGIEAARILFTPDKIKFINRKNNTYFVGNYAYFQKTYNVDIDFQLLQNILTNRFLILPENQEQKVMKTGQGLYNVETAKSDSLAQSFIINPAIKKLTNIVFKDLKKNATLSIAFRDYIDVENHNMPENIQISIEQNTQDVEVELNYKKITVDKNFKTPFRIPGKYEQVWP